MLTQVPCYGASKSAMILIEASTGKVLASQNAQVRLPMASLTKIMTALTVIRICQLDTKVKITAESVGVEGSSMYLKEGQVLTVRDLLYGLMLVSGNDAATALALHASGSIDKFADEMNKTAASLGLKNSHFLNPSGLYEEGHYTTALDLASLTCAALQNETFAQIVRTKTYVVENQTLVNHNRLLRELEGCIGVKTGYTKVCGRCLVSAVERDGVQLICVTLNWSNDWQTHKNLYEENFARCKRVKLLSEKEIYYSLPVAGGHSVGFYCPELYGVIIDGEAKITKHFLVPRFIYANKKKGDVIGKIIVKNYGKEIATADLILDRDTRVLSPQNSKFGKFFQFILHLFGF